MLIAIAGADGAGKTTITRQLTRALDQEDFEAVALDRFAILDRQLCPAASFVAADIHELRRHVLHMTRSPRLLFLLWSMSMTLAEPPAAPERRERVVVYDSYWMKHAAAEIVYGVDESTALAIAGLLPRPDLTFYLKLSPERSLERKRGELVAYECGLDSACSPESFLAHQRRIQALLDAWSRRDGWIELDARASVESTVGEILGRLRPRLAPPGETGVALAAPGRPEA